MLDIHPKKFLDIAIFVVYVLEYALPLRTIYITFPTRQSSLMSSVEAQREERQRDLHRVHRALP